MTPPLSRPSRRCAIPTKIKILLSVLVVMAAAAIAWTDFTGPRPDLGYIVVAIAAVMLLGLWIFPEAGGGKPTKRSR
ncbi:MAG: hypothetical protein GDA41_03840 [Rhodospirillales bacterium]|nr:hypothetical protein [Rhodospirillales bacterium]